MLAWWWMRQCRERDSDSDSFFLPARTTLRAIHQQQLKIA